MDEFRVFQDQLDRLGHTLDHISRLLGETRRLREGVDDRVFERFAQLVQAQQRQIREVRGRPAGPGAVTPDLWQAVERIEVGIATLAEESLAFLGGMLIRQLEVDQGVCLIADALCQEWAIHGQLSPGILAVPGPADSFTRLTNLVRVRFPDFSVWSLPIVAHEFGHYVESQSRDRYFPHLFADIREAEGLGRSHEPVLREQFADLFGVYALGPAYVCTCILQEFNPYLAFRETPSHPSMAQRAHFLLAALERMQQADPAKPFQSVIDQVTGFWQAGTAAVDSAARLADEVLHSLNRRLEQMLQVLDDPANQMAGVRYGTARWGVARALRRETGGLAAPDSRQFQDAQGRSGSGRGPVALVDVLNAAWLCRLEQIHPPPDEISRQALAICHTLLSG